MHGSPLSLIASRSMGGYPFYMIMNHYTSWIGIDPGLNGAIAVQHSNWTTQAFRLPKNADGSLNLLEISHMIDNMLGYDQNWGMYRPTLVYIEKVGSMPGQGVASSFKFGLVTGMMHGLIAAKGLDVFTVHPVKWKNRILPKGCHSKQDAIDYCKLKFPDVDLVNSIRSHKEHDGICDALCISEYARYFHSENTKCKSSGNRANRLGAS